MHAAEESHLHACIRIFVLRHFLKTVEQRVHNDDISAETVNAWGQDKIEWRPVQEAVAPAQKAVSRDPANEFNKMWPRQTGDSMPEDFACFFDALSIGSADGNVLDALRVEMNLAMVAMRQSLEQLGQGTFGAVAAIHERRNCGQAQISESNGGRAARQQRHQIERQGQAWATGIARLGEATNRR